jgi:hypothetical protein
MRISFPGLLIAALALTLGLKLVVFRQVYARPDDPAHAQAMVSLLTAEGFKVETRPMMARLALTGHRSGCKVAATRIDGRGHGRDRFLVAWAERGPVSYYYRGATYASFPRVRPLLEEQFWRLLQPLTGGGSFRPVIAFARSEDCPVAVAQLGPALSQLKLEARPREEQP